MSNKKNGRGVKLWAVAFWLIVWQIAAVSMKQEIFLVSPVSCVKTLIEMMKTREYYERILYSTLRVLHGFAYGMLFGSLLGAVSAKVAAVRSLMAPLIAVIRAIPVASFIILAVFFLEDAQLSVFISLLICFPVFYTNVLNGVQNVNGQLIEMADVFRIGPVKRIVHIHLPNLYPYIRSAVSVSIGLAWKSGIAAEVIAIPAGSIGDRLYYVKMYFITGELFAWTITIILLSLLCEAACQMLLHLFGRRLEGKNKA